MTPLTSKGEKEITIGSKTVKLKGNTRFWRLMNQNGWSMEGIAKNGLASIVDTSIGIVVCGAGAFDASHKIDQGITEEVAEGLFDAGVTQATLVQLQEFVLSQPVLGVDLKEAGKKAPKKAKS